MKTTLLTLLLALPAEGQLQSGWACALDIQPGLTVPAHFAATVPGLATDISHLG